MTASILRMSQCEYSPLRRCAAEVNTSFKSLRSTNFSKIPTSIQYSDESAIRVSLKVLSGIEREVLQAGTVALLLADQVLW